LSLDATAPRIHGAVAIAGRLSLLMLALFANLAIGRSAPAGSILLPVFLAMVLANAKYQAAEKKVVRLWQLVALCAALYSLLHYPLMAPMPGSGISARIYEGILVAWLISIAAGGLCFWIPSLAALPPAFLLWCNAVCGLVTGLPSTTDSDIQPLTEVSVCIGLGLLINQVYSLCNRASWTRTNTIADSSITARASFANLLFLLAISVHLANYFWSFYAKSWLDGPGGRLAR
jgi:hypothetical protein